MGSLGGTPEASEILKNSVEISMENSNLLKIFLIYEKILYLKT